MNEEFTKSNSMAVWRKKDDKFSEGLKIDSLEKQDINFIKNYFKEDYYDENNNHMYFDTDWISQLNSKRVVVRAMPNKLEYGANVPKDTLFSFHWVKNNHDYRLAAALYGTSFWGGFITNLSNKIGTNKQLDQQDVKNLFNRIDPDARIIALGTKTFNEFAKYAGESKYTGSLHHQKPSSFYADKHVITYIPDYSDNNGGTETNDWNTKKAHDRIIESESFK